ncbi:hypothetical protein K9L16_01640 [Candidatus Pacearchaeota archaeon]|nr:hypothetical protein [Candidatus Pacearchaeota archaeon]
MEKSYIKYPRERRLRESSLRNKVISITAGLVFAAGALGGTIKYDQIQKKQLEKAFSNTCGITKININNYNQFGSDTPYAIAIEEALNLRKKHKQRFEKVSNEEIALRIMESYNEKTKEIIVPKFDCDKPQ